MVLAAAKADQAGAERRADQVVAEKARALRVVGLAAQANRLGVGVVMRLASRQDRWTT